MTVDRLEHTDFDTFEVGVNGNGCMVMMHIPCQVTMLGDKSLYASFFTRTVEQHLQVCSVVNATGQHAAPW
jgi:hypothetical protein